MYIKKCAFVLSGSSNGKLPRIIRSEETIP